MENAEVCVRKGGMFFRTVEKSGYKPDCLPQGYKDKQYERLEGMRNMLLAFTNERLGICPQFEPPICSDETKFCAFRISFDLWSTPSIIDQFIEMEGDALSRRDLEVIASWKDAIAGPMFCMETFGDKALMLCEGYVFEAASFGRTWDDMVPYPPDLVVTSLLPYEGEIVMGGFTTKHRYPMGGMELIELNEEYRSALNRGIIADNERFCAASREIRALRQSRGLDSNSWRLYRDLVEEVNAMTAGLCRPYVSNVRLWE